MEEQLDDEFLKEQLKLFQEYERARNQEVEVVEPMDTSENDSYLAAQLQMIRYYEEKKRGLSNQPIVIQDEEEGRPSESHLLSDKTQTCYWQ